MTADKASDDDPRDGMRWSDWLRTVTDDDDWNRNDEEPVAEGGGHLLDLVAAVDYLRRGVRPGFTVWDAIEEALRWTNVERTTIARGAPPTDADEIDPDDPDPLRTQLRRLVDLSDDSNGYRVDELFQQAVRRWARTMASRYNAGYAWPHPMPRQTFPPPAQ